jgi:hypothetical protein
MDRSGGRVEAGRRFVVALVADEVVVDTSRVGRRQVVVVVASYRWEVIAQLLQLKVPQDLGRRNVGDWLMREQIGTEIEVISPTMPEEFRLLVVLVARLPLLELAEQDP